MGRRRQATGISGILAVDKPPGMTSHDVITHVRRATGERRVGHAGTLDPAATGVLVVLVGPATRLAPYLMAAEKSYLARVEFGKATSTDDAEGETLREARVPSAVADKSHARSVVADLVGTHQQVPPDFSALKQGGVKAYHAARSGDPLDLAPRVITVTTAELVSVDPGPPVTWELALTVTKGTYVRAIARDLGESLGTAAHLSSLRRTASGTVNITHTHALSEISEAGADIASLFADPVEVLGLPVVEVDPSTAQRVATGASVPADDARGQFVAVAAADSLLGIFEWDEPQRAYRPRVVLPGGVRRCA